MSTSTSISTSTSGNNGKSSMSSMVSHGIVATESTGDGTIGAIVWWRLSGGLPMAALAASWAAEGLAASDLPGLPGPLAAVRRALVEQCHNDQRIAKPLQGRESWALYERSADKREYAVILSASVNADDSLAIEAGYRAVLASDVDAAYRKHRAEVNAQDVSAWVTRLVESCDGVSLREMGGVYYVPPHRVERWEQIVRALRACGSAHRIHYAPAMRSSDAIGGFVDAVAAEAETEVAAIEAEIAAGKLGERALASRITRADEIEAKIGRYAASLGVDMDAADRDASEDGAIQVGGTLARVATRLVDLRATVAAAIADVEARKAAAAKGGA